MSLACDIAVIGAGPAGLAAATVAAEQGAQVIVLDEQAAPGGQIYRAIEQGSAALHAILGPDYASGAGLVARFRASRATYAPGSAVWQITPGREVWIRRDGHSERITAEAVIIATGAIERPVPVPGWTLPGVMTAGAVQILLKSSGAVPTDGLVLAGSGPLLYLLGWQLLRSGRPPSAILDTTSSADQRRALRLLPSALARREAFGYLRQGLAYKSALRRARLRMVRSVTDIHIEGAQRVEAIRFQSGGRQGRIPARLVALHEGVIPAQQATRSLGCEHEWDDRQRCFRPVHDTWGNTSVPGILVAGDAGGIGGAQAAEHAGRIVAWEALRRIGRVDAARRDRAASGDIEARAAHLAIRPMLDRLYAPRAEILRPADDVTVCRCEEVTARQVRAVVKLGCPGPNQAKSFLRTGMGPCQGRLCGNTVSELIAAERGVAVSEVGYFRIRPPLKPVSVGELAALDVSG